MVTCREQRYPTKNDETLELAIVLLLNLHIFPCIRIKIANVIPVQVSWIFCTKIANVILVKVTYIFCNIRDKMENKTSQSTWQHRHSRSATCTAKPLY